MPEPRSRLTPQHRWSETAARYRSATTGKFVPAQTIRDALDTALVNAAKDAATLAAQLKDGAITLADWQLGMAQQVKLVHLASSALGKGGWAQLTQADYGRVGATVKSQLQFLNGFAAAIADGTQRLDGTLARRAALYVQAGRTTYHEVQRRVLRVLGMTEERRVLHARESCPSCLRYAAGGWAALGTYPLPGQQSECRTNCRCDMQYRAA